MQSFPRSKIFSQQKCDLGGQHSSQVCAAVSFLVSCGQAKDFEIIPECGAASLVGVPTVPYDRAGHGHYSLAAIKSVVVDSRYAASKDDAGQTLIPPTLDEFAKTFASDLGSLLDRKIPVVNGHSKSRDAVFLTLGDSRDYLDAAHRPTSEGYSLNVTSTGLVITGASPLGAWWGTRTVLQQIVLNGGSMALGESTDSPGWGTRGMMLDAGRHYYPPEFIEETCSYMSFFKQNTFHLHLSDNLYNNVDIYSRERSLDLYARFRLWSDSPDLAGLNKYKNESYTREQFESMQSACAARGVTIIPEIEAPGHALVIVQWKPELGLENDLSLLNISNPETIPTMKLIWGTFLDWFHTKTVHIGADEYTGPVDDYNTFVNVMASYIGEVSGKSIRIWGTFPPNYTAGYTNIYKNVSIQHWEYFEDDPYYDYILNNYSTLNSDDAFYVVNKYSGYPQQVNISRTFHGNPEDGGFWYPYIFNMNNVTDNPAKSNPLVLGEIAPLWNDYGANASVYTEAYYAWQDGIPALADKQWGGKLTEGELLPTLSKLLRHIPGQNLQRSIRSKTSLILKYYFSRGGYQSSRKRTMVKDWSENGYDGETSCPKAKDGSLYVSPSCSLTSPLSSKGRNYTLTLSLKVDKLLDRTNATLVYGSDSSLMLTPNITLFASGNYYRLNSTLPLGRQVDLSIIARGNQTFAKIGDEAEEEFLAKLGINGVRFVWTPIGVEAPLAKVGGSNCAWSGELMAMSLSSEA